MRIQKPADLARTVKTRRQAQGLTQQDIADAVGITRQSLARIERGHGGASFDTVLRIFEKLGIRLEATSNDDRHLAFPIPATNNDTLRQATSAALAAIRNIDTTAIAAAATAATRNIDSSIRRQSTLNGSPSPLRETATRAGFEPSAREARQALLNAVIAAGDPDREDSTAAGEVHRRETSDGAVDG